MCERKYSQYIIKITYLNNDTEEINYKDYNTTDYKTMLELYRETKEQYKNESVRIDFCGKNQLEELNVIFTKEIKGIDYIIKQEAEEVTEQNIYDLIDKLEKNIKLLIGRKKYVNDQYNLFNEKRNIQNHELETYGDRYSDEKKLEEVNRIIELSKLRRKYKTECKAFERISFDNINKLLSNVGDAKHFKENSEEIQQICEYNLNELMFIREYPYRTFNQRNSVLNQIKPKYDKVIDEVSNMKLLAYNRCGTTKSGKAIEAVKSKLKAL